MSEDQENQRCLWLEAQEKNRQEWSKKWNEWIKSREKVIDREAKEGRAYTNLIIGAGYAAFFGLWHLVGPKLNDVAMAISCLSILISGTLFVSFEIYKTFKQGMIISRNSKLANSDLPPEEKNKKYDEVYESLSGNFYQIWIIHFVLCILFSAIGVLILAWNFIIILIQKL